MKNSISRKYLRNRLTSKKQPSKTDEKKVKIVYNSKNIKMRNNTSSNSLLIDFGDSDSEYESELQDEVKNLETQNSFLERMALEKEAEEEIKASKVKKLSQSKPKPCKKTSDRVGIEFPKYFNDKNRRRISNLSDKSGSGGCPENERDEDEDEWSDFEEFQDEGDSECEDDISDFGSDSEFIPLFDMDDDSEV